MARQCLFCSNPVNSREHIWSDWILKDLKSAKPIRIRIGKRTDVWSDKPEVLVKCVCDQCNNGWMSRLESLNKPHMHSMMHDTPVALSPTQQKLLTRWAVLKAIIIEAVNRERTPFYDEGERFNLKPPSSFIPVGTSVWIGRSSINGFHAGGTDIWRQVDEVPKALHGCVTNIVVGRLFIQVLTVHALVRFAASRPSFECNSGTWDVNLLDVWPVFGERRWPPPVTFTARGPNSIGTVITRWNLGDNIA
jgi:hypothetical protein